MLISIDHGNKQIKTPHHIFTSGLLESTNRPAFGEEILYYRGKYYSLTEERIPYMRDKTATDPFSILTLFAIAKEILSANTYTADDILDVKLNVGLPPSHYSSLYEKYEAYFQKSDILDFNYNGKPFSVYISEVNSYPQAYAAAMTVFSMIKDQPKTLILDIGGFTADYLMLKHGQAELSICDSLENGVIILYNSIRSKLSADFDILLDESDIGSILHREYIEKSNRLAGAIIIDDIAANAKGYEVLYRASHRR